MNDFMSMAYGLAFWLGKLWMESRFDTNRGLDGGRYCCLLLCCLSQ